MTDQTQFRRGCKLAERMWKDGGVTAEKIRATLLKLLEDDDPGVLLGFQAAISSFSRTASARKRGAEP